MIENLRLDNTAEHNSDGSLSQGYGTSTTDGNFGGLAEAESSNFTDSTTANSLYYSGTQEGTASINIGTSNYPEYRMPRYNNLNTANRATNPTSNTFSNNNTTGGMYSYGNYYTWHAAIADLTSNITNNQSTTDTSLCPSGWHLPKGGSKSNETNNEFWSLVVNGINGGIKPAEYDSSYTRPGYINLNGLHPSEGSDVSNKLRTYPNNFLYSGNFSTSSVYNRGSTGTYWSSTASTNGISYSLNLGSSYVDPGNDNLEKYRAASVRCTFDSKLDPELTADIPDISYGEDLEVKVYTNPLATGTVEITLMDSTFSNLTLVNGYVSSTISSLPEGSYEAVINYLGDKNYASKTITVPFEVLTTIPDPTH